MIISAITILFFTYKNDNIYTYMLAYIKIYGNVLKQYSDFSFANFELIRPTRDESKRKREGGGT